MKQMPQAYVHSGSLSYPAESAMAQASANMDPPAGGDARAWQVLAEMLDGKLDVQTLCQRHQMRVDEVHGWLRDTHRSALMAFDAQLKRALIRQGASPEALVGPQLNLSLDDVTLLDWIQAIQIFAKQAVISVLHDEGESRVWCSQGAVIDASSGGLRGEAAFHRIAAIERGEVLTELRAVSRERTIRASTTSLLLEAARRKDERALLERKLGGIERYFLHATEPALGRSLDTEQAALLQLFDQPRRLGDVVAQSQIGDVETLEALDGLLRSGQLIEAPAASVEAQMQRDASSEPVSAAEKSLPPIAFTWPPAPPARSNDRRWIVSTFVMGVVMSGAAWMGTQTSVTNAPDPVLATPLAAPAALAYAVAVRTEPAEAELRVDGQSVGRGGWTATLPRDGVAHELRVSADGFAPVRVIFIDTPPPPDVRLEPLSIPPTPASALVRPAAADTEARVHSAEVAALRRAFVPRRESLARLSSEQAGLAAPAAAAPSAPLKKRPFVQIIDGDAAPLGRVGQPSPRGFGQATE